MKKIITLLFLLIFTQLSVCAEVLPRSIYAVSEHNINGKTLKNGDILTFQTIDNYSISDTTKIEKNSIITLKVKKYMTPKRGKRNGYLKAELTSFTLPSEGGIKYSNIGENNCTLRLSTPKDFKEIAKNTGVTVTGHILKIPGFSQAVAVSKGLLKPNPNQNRLKSAGTNLYESTPLTYTEKGEDLNIEEDSIVLIRIKYAENEDNE